MNIQPKTSKMIILLIGFCLIVSSQTSFAQNASTILILPFDVRTDAKYAFLEAAVVDMLFTRLSAPGRTLLVAETDSMSGMSQTGSIALTDAVKLGQQMRADYIVAGNMILQDDTISTEAEFIGVVEQRTLITFNQKGLQPGDIITQIDNFTSKINADIFNPSAATEEDAEPSEAPDDVYQHPEKLVIPQTPPK